MEINPDDKRKHLEFVQAIINRMAQNSFLFKGWSITIIAGITAFATKDSNPALMAVPLVAAFLFWGVDAYYLMLERAFRNLYNRVAANSEAPVDFLLTPAEEEVAPAVWFRTLFRPILSVFYIIVIVLLVALIIFINHIGLHVTVTHGA